MREKEIAKKELKGKNGIMWLFLILLSLLVSIVLFIAGPSMIASGLTVMVYLGILSIVAASLLCIAGCIGFAGLKAVRPNEALILTLFGNYYGTISEAGFYFVNPFCTAISPAYEKAANEAAAVTKGAEAKGNTGAQAVRTRKRVSLKTMTLDNGRQKVNDVLGNPIIIGAVVIWRVADPTKAVFNVDDYPSFLSIQTDSTIRNISRLYPYDIFDEDDGNEIAGEKSLRGSSLEIADNMRTELQKRVETAGIVVEEVRITHIAYAEEIAAAMLQRQQAAAIIAARQKIVDGAVGMVKMAIEKLGEDEIVVLDEERKAAMVSNLLVVLCGNKDAQPIVNSGSIY